MSTRRVSTTSRTEDRGSERITNSCLSKRSDGKLRRSSTRSSPSPEDKRVPDHISGAGKTFNKQYQPIIKSKFTEKNKENNDQSEKKRYEKSTQMHSELVTQRVPSGNASPKQVPQTKSINRAPVLEETANQLGRFWLIRSGEIARNFLQFYGFL